MTGTARTGTVGGEPISRLLRCVNSYAGKCSQKPAGLLQTQLGGETSLAGFFRSKPILPGCLVATRYMVQVMRRPGARDRVDEKCLR